MKMIMIVLMAMMMTPMAQAEVSEKLINAVIQQESNGDDSAIGDKGNAVGCLQIWKSVVDDVNRFSRKHYTYADRYNREKSKEMFRLYVGHYATTNRLGRKVTDEDKARIWNGGPNGWKMKATKGYWKSVKAKM